MDNKPFVTITYKTANGIKICVEVSTSVKRLIEQSDRKFKSQRRQDRRHLSKEEYIDGLTDTTTVCPQEDFADLIIRMDRNKQLYSAIETLSEIQRRRLFLYYFAELSYRQIGRMEGVNHKSVIRSVEQALKKLRNHFIK